MCFNPENKIRSQYNDFLMFFQCHRRWKNINRWQGWGQLRICICVFVFESSVVVFDLKKGLYLYLYYLIKYN